MHRFASFVKVRSRDADGADPASLPAGGELLSRGDRGRARASRDRRHRSEWTVPGVTKISPEGPADRGRRFRLGTRGSALALAQTAIVLHRLATTTVEAEWIPEVIRTEGDVDKTSPLTVIGGQGVFTSALQEALARHEIDAAVHSAKDLPSIEPDGLVLRAFPVREDPRDVLVSRHGVGLAGLPASPRVGTSSRRRAVQVQLARPDARIVELRGNIDTRLRKALDPAENLDAIVIAAAGVLRMGWADRITEFLPLNRFIPSPGQGALAVEGRCDDRQVDAALARIDDARVSAAIRIERAFLAAIGAGCTTPVGAHAVEDGTGWRLRAMLAGEDGDRVEWADERVDMPGEEAAAELAVRLLARVRATGGMTFGYRTGPLIAPGHADDDQGHAEDRRPLRGRSVLVTRAAHQAEPLLEALRGVGGEPVALPTIEIVPPVDPGPLRKAVQEMAAGRYHWVVLTSANAVEQMVGANGGTFARETLGGARVAAVGAATAKRLQSFGIDVDLLPGRPDASALADALVPWCGAGCRLLYPHGDLARETIASRMEQGGAHVDAVPAYRTVPVLTADAAMLGRLRSGEIDIVTFASPSSVRNLVRMLGDSSHLEKARVVCVGAVTARAVRELGLPVDVIADDATVDGLVRAVIAVSRARDEAPSMDHGRMPPPEIQSAGAPVAIGGRGGMTR